MLTRASGANLAFIGAALVSMGLVAALASTGAALSKGLAVAIAAGDAHSEPAWALALEPAWALSLEPAWALSLEPMWALASEPKVDVVAFLGAGVHVSAVRGIGMGVGAPL